MSTLGSRLRKVRGSRSQLMFAREAGVTQNTLSRYELDKGRPDADFLSFVCTTCNVSPNWLLLGVEDGGPGDESPRTLPEETGAGLAAAIVRGVESDAIAERAERRELALENRRLYRQVEQLLRENAYLRVRLAEAGIVLLMAVPSPVAEGALGEQEAGLPDKKPRMKQERRVGAPGSGRADKGSRKRREKKAAASATARSGEEQDSLPDAN